MMKYNGDTKLIQVFHFEQQRTSSFDKGLHFQKIILALKKKG